MKRFFMLLPALLAAALLLARPEAASAAVREGISLCVRTVIPSLFPFLAVTALLLQLGLDSLLRPLCAPIMRPLFRMRGECAAPLLAGFLGGYPAGVRASAQLYEQGRLSRSEAERLLGFCNNCSPGFLVGFVGAEILGSSRVGVALLLIHIAAALLTGMLLCRMPESDEPPALSCRLPAEHVSFPSALTAAVSGALTSTAGICAYVILFRVGAALMGTSVPPIALGILELVGGISALKGHTAGFVAAAALTAFGGTAVHCQAMAVAGDLRLRYHTAGKLLHALLSALLALLAAQWVYR